MTYYFAVFLPAEEGGYGVEFPDFPEAFTQGNDFSEAMDMAKDVLAITVEEYTKARKELPAASSLDAVARWAKARSHDAGVNPEKSFHVQAFAAPKVDMTPVRVSVSFTKSVLDEIDAKAASQGMTRSGFIAKAAQAYPG